MSRRAPELSAVHARRSGRVPRKIALCALGSLIIGAFALMPSFAFALGELRDLYRDPRALAMGNAYTAIAEDTAALYYNPACLAGVRGMSVQLATLDVEAASDIVSSIESDIKSVTKLSSDTLNLLLGKNIYGRASLAPTIVLPGFGIGVLVDQQVALRGENKALPQFNLGYQTTNGVQAGYAMSFSPRRGGKDEIRVGVGAKILWRRGGYRYLTLTQILNASQDTYKQIAGDFSKGFGIDLGTQYVRHVSSHLDLLAGLSFRQIGDVTFSSGSDPVQGNLSAGVAARYRLPGVSATLSADYQDINRSTDWRMRTHFGAELGLPLVSLYAGLNQFFPTYGVSADVWFARVTAVVYKEEIGSLRGQDPERRILLQLAFGFGI